MYKLLFKESRISEQSFQLCSEKKGKIHTERTTNKLSTYLVEWCKLCYSNDLIFWMTSLKILLELGCFVTNLDLEIISEVTMFAKSSELTEKN